MKNKKYTVIQIEKAIMKTLQSLSDRTFEKTMKGKNSAFEVTKEDWSSAGVEFEDIKNRIIELLNN